MPRPRVHTTDAMLDAARDLVVEGGVRAATIDRVVAVSGASKGSVYHRFATLDDLLAAMWLRAVRRTQQAFLWAVEASDPVEAAVAGALAIYDAAAAHPTDARLLALVGRVDLLGTVTDDGLRRELEEANVTVMRAARRLARRLFDSSGRPALERTLFAVVDLPLGALRRHLLAGRPLPVALRGQVARAVRAALTQSDDPV